MKTKILFDFLLLSFSFCLLSCDTNDPPPGNGNKETITISVEDTSPTEVWLNVATKNLQLPNELLLLRNGDTSDVFSLTKNDTLIYDDSLQPSTTYTYQVTPKGTGSNRQPIISNEVTAVTMDTTSHNFTWEVFEFGEHGNSILRDVAIIDENNIWAVGAIYLKDSTGANDSKLYNAVQWDGSQWNVQRITLNYNNRLIVPAMHGIYAFSENDIWTASGIPTHWDGEEWVQYHLYDMGVFTENDGSVYKVYGSSPNDVYFVGNKGSIAHYNGTSWRKIESPTGTGGTEVDLRDVWGDGSKVFITGMDDSNGNTVLLSLNNLTLQTLYDYNVLSPNQGDLEGFVRGVWFNEFPYFYLLTSSHVTRIRKDNMEEQKRIYKVSPDFTGGYHHIRGSGINDLMIVGNRNHIAHYNGISWREYTELYDYNVLLRAVSIKDDLIVIVGEKQEDLFTHKAIVVVGRR